MKRTKKSKDKTSEPNLSALDFPSFFNIKEKDLKFDSIKNHNELIVNKKINKIGILFKKIDNKND